MTEWMKLKAILPHRYPMLMIDEIEELTEGRAVGWKRVTVNEPYFRGHFPKAPVMPGVLVVEALCQLTWVWLGAETRMIGIRKLRFRRPTLPGDRLRLEIEPLQHTSDRCIVRATASVEEQAALTGELEFAVSV